MKFPFSLLIGTLVIAVLGLFPLVATAEVETATTVERERPARHGAWSALLGAYVRPNADGVNRFDYGALQANADDRAALAGYIESFERLDFSALTRDEAFAAWANLYNALTVQHIVERYPVRSIRSGYFIGPWKQVKTQAGGGEVSLDEIEHDILRVQWDEPRVHYAVNCASIGCPNLRTTAWEAATLEADLDAAARAYVNHPRGVSVRARGGLEVSSIYKWFDDDFGGSEAGVIEHLLQYAEPDLAAQIRATPDIRGYDYDWDLNDVE
ncbi:MAG: DUF547 domain-containing protein [Hyphomonadaceae bacterium]|nr:DUF547 domain-containing protein [Hyphomonadaceae bacterium]